MAGASGSTSASAVAVLKCLIEANQARENNHPQA
jgi:hypothetical protein